MSQEIEPPLHGVLNRPPVALVMIGEICFIFKKYPCGMNLKLGNSVIVFLRVVIHFFQIGHQLAGTQPNKICLLSKRSNESLVLLY